MSPLLKAQMPVEDFMQSYIASNAATHTMYPSYGNLKEKEPRFHAELFFIPPKDQANQLKNVGHSLFKSMFNIWLDINCYDSIQIDSNPTFF